MHETEHVCCLESETAERDYFYLWLMAWLFVAHWDYFQSYFVICLNIIEIKDF